MVLPFFFSTEKKTAFCQPKQLFHEVLHLRKLLVDSSHWPIFFSELNRRDSFIPPPVCVFCPLSLLVHVDFPGFAPNPCPLILPCVVVWSELCRLADCPPAAFFHYPAPAAYVSTSPDVRGKSTHFEYGIPDSCKHYLYTNPASSQIGIEVYFY